MRSRVPEENLRMVRKEGVILNITFSVGKLPIKFDWMVQDFSDKSTPGTKELARGGDSYQ